MSVGVLAPVHDWDGFEAACAELQACSADVARFLDAEIAELDRWQAALEQASVACVASVASPLPSPVHRGGLACDPSDSADESASANQRQASADASVELLARLETLCGRIEGEWHRVTSLADGSALCRSNDGADEQPEGDRQETAQTASQSYRRRLRALAEQVLVLERDRCGTAAELAAARLRARELARELKRQKNSFSAERRRWLRKLSAIERALESLSASNAATAPRRPLPAERRPAQNANVLETPNAGLTDELLIEAILAKCEMSAEGRSG